MQGRPMTLYKAASTSFVLTGLPIVGAFVNVNTQTTQDERLQVIPKASG